MDTGTAATALLAAAAAAIIFFTVRIGSSATGRVRERFAVMLQRVRMHRMLQKRGIETGDYLARTDPSAIRRQLAACEACPATSQCDAAMALPDAPSDRADFSFCPNDAALSGLPRTEPSRQAEPNPPAAS